MFKRNKNQNVEQMQQLYQQFVNSNLNHLTSWQQGRFKDAVIGFRTLHQQADVQLDIWNKESRMPKSKWTSDEMLLLDELNKVRAEIEDNWHLVEGDYERVNDLQHQKFVQLQQQQQQQRVQQQHEKRWTSDKNRRRIAPYSNRLLKRSLRPNGGGGSTSLTQNGSNNNNNSSSSTSESAKQAANIIWAPSNSMNTQKSDSLTSNSSSEQLFSGFDSNENAPFPNETLKNEGLYNNINKSNSSGSFHETHDNDITDQMNQMKLNHKQQAPQSNGKDRSRAALKASAQVRYPQRPDTMQHYHSNANSHQSQNQLNIIKPYTSSPARPYKANNNSASSLNQQRPRSSSPIKVTTSTTNGANSNIDDDDDTALFKELRIDPEMGKQIMNDMNSNDDEVHWDDIAGLENAKQALMEAVVWPLLRPDLFKGLRQPPNGMLLFGPPGTGKTMLARAAATESSSNFFSIQASSITSKFLGESEKLVKALFQIAKAKAPSIIFVDEIDSIMGQRSSQGEHESMRRVKNEFLVQWSSLTKSAGRGESSRVLVLAATNLPWAIDEAARRRFVKRQYIPLPEVDTRRAQFSRLLQDADNNLNEDDFNELVKITEGYSGSDIDSLTKDAAMSTTRGLTWEQMMDKTLTVRPISLDDFKISMKLIKPSVGKDGLAQFDKWAKEFGSSGA